jgi:hypothetical protein
MDKRSSGYRAYLLRLWQVRGAHWRASIEDPHTGERRAFASVEQLAAFLIQSADLGFPAASRDVLIPTGDADGDSI